MQVSVESDKSKWMSDSFREDLASRVSGDPGDPITVIPCSINQYLDLFRPDIVKFSGKYRKEVF